jgi:hypothetical protein
MRRKVLVLSSPPDAFIWTFKKIKRLKKGEGGKQETPVPTGQTQIATFNYIICF